MRRILPGSIKTGLNEPANVKIVAEEVTRLKNLTSEELETVTDANARRLFNKIV